MKTDLYTFVHKAQRVRLFDLSGAIARADFEDGMDRERVVAELGDMLEHLREHAAIEDTYIHPLYRALGDVAAAFDAEHDLLEQEINRLEGIVHDQRWADLHRAYHGFLGRYLVHLDEEERAQETILWARYDEELADTFARFQSERTPEKRRADLEFLLPALSAVELIGMFRSMKLRAPAPVFEFAQTLGDTLVRPAIWAKVKTAIAS